MSISLRSNPRTMVPDLVDWFEEPFLTLRPYLGQAIRIEDFTEGGQYVVHAELAGIDPEKELEVSVGGGHLTIRVVRSDQVEGKHRSEFRHGSFSRILELPVGADAEDVTAEYADGILTVKIAVKGEQHKTMKKIQVTAGQK